MEAAHVDGQGHVVIHDVLHGPHDAQRMQGELIKRGAATIEQIALMLAVDQNFGGPLAQLQLVIDTVSELIQRFGDVPHQLQIRHVVTFFIGRQHVDVHQRGVAAVPHGRLVLHRAVADADNQVRQMEQPVARLVIEQTDASGEAGEVLLIHRAGGLIGAGDRNTAFLQQLAQRRAVGGLARHQPQQDDRVFSLFDKLRHIVNGGFWCRAHQRGTAGG